MKKTDLLSFDFLELGLSDFCQNNCIMCHQSQKWFTEQMQKGFSDTQLLLKLFDELVKEGIHFNTLYLFWIGEPLLHPQFSKILHGAFPAEKKTPFTGFVLNTNGTLLEDDILDSLLVCGRRAQFSQVILSLDSLSSQTYHKIRKGGEHQRVLQNLQFFLEKREHPFPWLIVQMIVMTENQQEIDDFIEKIQELGRQTGHTFTVTGSRRQFNGDTIYLRPLLYDQSWTESSPEALSWQKNFEIWQKTVARYDKDVDGAEILAQESADPRQQKSAVCSSPFQGIVVTTSGKVVPCCGDYFEELILGDLRKQTLRQILTSDTMQNFLATHLKNDRTLLPKRCQTCYLPAETTMPRPMAMARQTKIRDFFREVDDSKDRQP